MAGNTKALRVRIKSVNSTLALTKAMELVAASKIRRATDNMKKGRDYDAALETMIGLLTTDNDCLKSPYMQTHDTGRTKIIVIAGDRGLAGGYNANVFRLSKQYEGAEFIPIGKRACERYNKPIVSSEHFGFETAQNLADTLCEEFAKGEFDKLGIIMTRCNSVMSQDAVIRWVLPLQKNETSVQSDIIFEPDHITVLENVVREYVAGIITVAVRESFASEVSARRIAMDSAGKNARQMIDNLQLEYNRARQGAITQEITEIVAGSGNL